MRRTLAAAVTTLCFAALVGCTSTSGGTPAPVGTTSAGSTSTEASEPSATGDAPAITGPELDLGKAGGPCDLLKADQLAARGVTKPGREETDPAGPTCQWEPDDAGFGTSIGVTVLSESDGLDGFYANRERFPVFEPTVVAGYPAVNGDITDGKHGECSTAVGVAKGDGFLVQIVVNDRKKPAYGAPCSESSAIAEVVVANLRG